MSDDQPFLKKRIESFGALPDQSFKPEQLAPIDQLHMGGIESSRQLLEWLPTRMGRNIGLDMGCGLGGTARLAATHLDVHMVGTDICANSIHAARMLTQRSNQHHHNQCSAEFAVANSLQLPFAKQTFDFIISQHAMMAIADKTQLLSELDRVLKTDGLVLIHEVFCVSQQQAEAIAYPTPWASCRSDSYLQTWRDFINNAKSLGFVVQKQDNVTSDALTWLINTRTKNTTRPAMDQPDDVRSPHGISRLSPRLVLGDQAGIMSANLLDSLTNQHIDIIGALLVRK